VSQRTLSTYLSDHLAGSVAALELLDYLIQVRAGTAFAHTLSAVRTDVEQDQRVLEGLLRDVGAKPSRAREAVAWVTEKLERAKLRLDDPGSGEFRDFEAIETLALGIQGKASLWRALEASNLPELGSLDCSALQQRALDQFQRIEALRLEKAPAALSL
jgi:hypothetical protein